MTALDVYFIIIAILFYAYLYVRNTTPREGKLTRTIKRLEGEVDHWRKLACMRHLVLVALLTLFILPIANPSLSSIPAARGNERQEASFLPAADGDESSESLTAFAETLDDDVMFYPDVTSTLDITSYTATHNFDSLDTISHWTSPGGWYAWDTEESTGGQLHVREDFDLDVDYSLAETTNYDYEITASNMDHHTLYIKFKYITNYTFSPPTSYFGLNVDQDEGGYGSYSDLFVNFTEYANNTWHTIAEPLYDVRTSVDYVGLYISQASGAPTVDDHYFEVWVEYLSIVNLIEYDSSVSGYVEPFVDVSDWTEHGFEGNDASSTDGDVLTWILEDNDNSDIFRTDTPSLAAGSYYAEIRVKFNTTGFNLAFYSMTGDWGSGDLNTVGQIAASTSWVTWKFYHPYQVECLYFYANPPVDYEVAFDYLRIGNSTSMGWQCDGSTTEGVIDSGGGSISSDGSELTLTADSDGSVFDFVIDTTATAAYLDADYYLMISLDFNDADSADYIKVESYDGAAWATVIANTTVGTATHYANCRAADADIEKFRISVNPSANPRLKWFKAYSIANFTVTQLASCTTSDVIYVDSSDNLVFDRATTAWMVLELNPASSITISTYPVWNITKSGSDGFGIRLRGSPSWGWGTAQYGETRGATADLIPSSDTSILTIQIHSQTVVGVCTISALKFIEDGTAPAVVRSSSTPNDPSDDEGVMLTAVVTDAIEVYKVYFDAIVSPAGFSDVPYYATEQTDNLWTYEFATLPTGPYVFKIVATDGANENALTEYAYIELTVREAAITIEEITLAGAGSDFSMMTFSARINKDCSYVIYEESENNPEAATHSGSVSEPSFNLAWTKLSTTDTNVNFTIRFTNSTLVYNYTSQYQVAQTALAIDGDESLSQDEIIYSGTSTKACSWTLYLDSVQEDTGTISAAGSFVVNWTRTESVTPASISYAIKFYTATETIWENGTYDEYSLTAFSIQTLFMDLTDPSVSAIFTTSWGNATGYLYENDAQKDTGTEGVPLSYTKATVAGTYNVALKMDAGGEIAWYNTTYSVDADDALSITALSYDSSGPNVTLFVNTNWANCTLTLYENDVQKATGSEGTLSYLKATTAGDYNVSMKVDGTAAIEWANYTYTVAAESALIINTLILDKTGPNITAFITTNWLNCTITIYQDDVQKDSNSEGVTLSYSRSTAAGTYDIAIKIDGGASTLWHNDSYTIAIEYSWQYIYVFDTGDPAVYFPWESFDFYVNGSLIEKNEFHGRTDQGYRIAVVDKFGDTIYNATHSFDYTYRLSIAIYSFKIKCWVDGEVNVTITSSGGGVMNTWMGWGDLEPFHLYGSKTYQVKWHLDDSDRKVKATGWHYYPAIDWDGNQANPDPNWYGPVSASYLTIDDYGIGHLVGVVENIDDGGGGGDANNTALAQAAIAAIAPIAIGSVIATAGIVGAIVWYFLPSRIPGVREPPKPPTSNKPPRHMPAPSVGMASRKMQSRTSIKKKESRTK